MPCECNCHKKVEIDLKQFSKDVKNIVELPPGIEFYDVDGHIIFEMRGADYSGYTNTYMMYLVDDKNRKAGVQLNAKDFKYWHSNIEHAAKALKGWEL